MDNRNNDDEILENTPDDVSDDFDEEEVGDFEEPSEEYTEEELEEFFDELDANLEVEEIDPKEEKKKKAKKTREKFEKQRKEWEEQDRQNAINNNYNNPQYENTNYNNQSYDDGFVEDYNKGYGDASYDTPEYENSLYNSSNYDEYNKVNNVENDYGKQEYSNQNNSFTPNDNEAEKLREEAINERIRVQTEEQTYENRTRDGAYYNEDTGKYYKDGMETSASHIMNEQKRDEYRQQKEYENKQFRENYTEKLRQDYIDDMNSNDKGFGNSHIDLTARQNHGDDHSLEVESFKYDDRERFKEQKFGTDSGMQSSFSTNEQPRYVNGKNNYLSGRDYLPKHEHQYKVKDAFDGAKMIKDNSSFKTPIKQSLDKGLDKNMGKNIDKAAVAGGASRNASQLASPVDDSFINKAVRNQELQNIGVAVGSYAGKLGRQIGNVVMSTAQDGETAEGMRKVRQVSQPIAQQIGVSAANAHFKVSMNNLRKQDMTNVKAILMNNSKNAEKIEKFNLMSFNSKKDVADVRNMIIKELKAKGINASRLSAFNIKKEIANLKKVGGKEGEIALLEGLLQVNKSHKAGLMSIGKIKNLKNLVKRAGFAIISMAENSDVSAGGRVVHNTLKSAKTLTRVTAKITRRTGKIAGKATKKVVNVAKQTKPVKKALNTKLGKKTSTAINKANVGVKKAKKVIGAPANAKKKMQDALRAARNRLLQKFRLSKAGKAFKIISAPFRGILNAFNFAKAFMMKAAIGAVIFLTLPLVILFAAAGAVAIISTVATPFTWVKEKLFGGKELSEEEATSLYLQALKEKYDDLNTTWIENMKAEGNGYGIPEVEYKENSPQYKSGLHKQESVDGATINYINADGSPATNTYNGKELICMLQVMQESEVTDGDYAKYVLEDLFHATHNYTTKVYSDNSLNCNGCVEHSYHCTDAGRNQECKDEDLLYHHGNVELMNCDRKDAHTYSYTIPNSYKYKDLPKENLTLKYSTKKKQLYWITEDKKTIWIAITPDAKVLNNNTIDFTFDEATQTWNFSQTIEECKGHCTTTHYEYTCPGHKFIRVNAVVDLFHDGDTKDAQIFKHTDKDVDYLSNKVKNPQYIQTTNPDGTITSTPVADITEWLSAGWDDDNVDLVQTLWEVDWEEEYGVTFPEGIISGGGGNYDGSDLTEEEKQEILNRMPEGTSELRKNIVLFAASAEGKIPYVWGGSASKPGWDGIKSGLDCSHFVDWVYWTVVGDNLGQNGTAGLLTKSTVISESELKPGDVAFLYPTPNGKTNHIGIYAGKDSKGRNVWIHENGGAHNVSVNTVNYWQVYKRFTIMEGK